jgi:glycosyltransferase involved in cell wall biosynthesis
VIASEVGGLITLIEPGVNGYLVKERDPNVWADTVEIVIDNESTMSMSNSAVLHARRYTWRSAAESLAKLTEQLSVSGLVRC